MASPAVSQLAMDVYNTAWFISNKLIATKYARVQEHSERHYKSQRGAVRFNVFVQDCALVYADDKIRFYAEMYPSLKRRTRGDWALFNLSMEFVRAIDGEGGVVRAL